MDDKNKLVVHEPHNWMRKIPAGEFVGLLREQAHGTCEREPGAAKWMLEAARRIDDLNDRLDDCATGPKHG